ncbi:MAG: HDIG domain-containing metalloprotein [Dehalococcoidia bacterium]
MPRAQFYSSTRVATFVVALAVALTLALIPIDPERGVPELGDTPNEDIAAPQDLEFRSAALADRAAVLTEQARDAAAADVIPALIFDAGVRTAQSATLERFLAAVDAVRDDRLLTDAERAAQIRAIPGQFVSPSERILIRGLSGAQWLRVKERASALLEEVLNGAITEQQLQAARDAVPARIGLGFSPDESEVIAALVTPLLAANLGIDVAATEQARAAARAAVPAIGPTSCTFRAGETLFAAGVPVAGSAILSRCTLPSELTSTPLQGGALDALATETLALLEPEGGGVPADDLAALLILAVAAALTLGAYLALARPESAASDRRLLLIAALIVGAVALARWFLPVVLPDEQDKFLDLVLPLAIVAVLIAALLEQTLALVVAAVVALLAGTAAMVHPDYGLGQAPQAEQALRPLVVFLFSGVAGVFAAQRVVRITQYGAVGGVVGATVFVVGLAFWLLDPNRDTGGVAWLALTSLIVAVATGVLTIGAFSFLGAAVGITTRLQLLELAQLTQPLLQRLQEEAPGTFHHSLLVATMAERAATRVEADALLVRVGAYHHDVGKLAKPHMYIENQAEGVNPHDALDPLESARVIQEHVHWGMELARQQRIPSQVRAFIPEHHGTRLVTYFYRKAAIQDPEIDPGLFTYAGPRPQSRETAIVMMADSCEAVVRSSKQRDVDTIDRLIDAVISERLNEHQFDDCDLTLRQIRQIAESFKVTLHGVYHPRIEYPEPTAAERRAGAPPPIPARITPAPAPIGDAPVDGSALPTLSPSGEGKADTS